MYAPQHGLGVSPAQVSSALQWHTAACRVGAGVGLPMTTLVVMTIAEVLAPAACCPSASCTVLRVAQNSAIRPVSQVRKRAIEIACGSDQERSQLITPVYLLQRRAA